MISLTVTQLEQVNGGGWRGEALCGIGLGTLIGYSLSTATIPIVGAAALATSLITSGIVTLACRGWFG